jgi:spore maturation protein CgeB
VDADRYRRLATRPWAALSYLGTYALDRAEPFETLLLGAASRLPDESFLVGGPNYPGTARWPSNVQYRPHVPQTDHETFYSSGRFTLNLTRGPMRRWGHCPSARLFESAALGVPVMTDDWPGLDSFFTAGVDIALVRSAEEVVGWAGVSEAERNAIARRARERVLDTCTAAVRAVELERLLSGVRSHAVPVAAALES